MPVTSPSKMSAGPRNAKSANASSGRFVSRLEVSNMPLWIMARVAIVAGFGSLVSGVAADPITFFHRGVVRGTFNGQPLPITPFQIVATADTDDVTEGPPGLFVWHEKPARLDLTGIGSFTLDLSTYTYWNRSADTGQVGVSSIEDGILIGPVTPGLVDWDMQSSIGPVFGNGTITGVPLDTSGGTLDPIQVTDTQMSFQAIVVPEPATATTLCLVAFAAAGALRRRI